VVTYEGEAAVLTVFNDITEQVAAEQALKASESRMAAQSVALTDLTAQYTRLTTHFDDRLRAILMTSARTLQVDRLSMWHFDEARRAIQCIGLYRCRANRHESGASCVRVATGWIVSSKARRGCSGSCSRAPCRFTLPFNSQRSTGRAGMPATTMTCWTWEPIVTAS
jgi:hypothetical protein